MTLLLGLLAPSLACSVQAVEGYLQQHPARSSDVVIVARIGPFERYELPGGPSDPIIRVSRWQLEVREVLKGRLPDGPLWFQPGACFLTNADAAFAEGEIALFHLAPTPDDPSVFVPGADPERLAVVVRGDGECGRIATPGSPSTVIDYPRDPRRLASTSESSSRCAALPWRKLLSHARAAIAADS